jgi:hypothetical protein
MALSNYSDLKATIANYLGRSDLTNQIPDFISLAEIRLSRALRIREMLNTATATMTAGDPTVGLPSDFLEMRDLFVEGNPRMPVSYLTPSSFTRDLNSGFAGKPVYYTMRGSEFEFGPVPDAAYEIQMIYYAKPQELSNTNPSNAFMAKCPDALLYGSLGEAESYLMNDPRLPLWAELYRNAVADLTVADDRAEYAGVPLFMKLS